jgi:hypothetical protein
VGEKFYLGSLLDFHTFVKAHWQEKNLSVSGGHVIKWNFSSAKKGVSILFYF